MKYLNLIILLLIVLNQQVLSKDLNNDFLVAKPHMPDPRFKETVIFMLYHNQEGAAGLVVNKPIRKISISELFIENNLTPPDNMVTKEITLYWGGPVEPNNIFFIHSSEYQSNEFLLSNKNFIVTQKPDVLRDIAKNLGPKKYLILSGIAVWSSGQLDQEMAQGDWDKKSNSYIPLFDNGQEMWHRLISSQDI